MNKEYDELKSYFYSSDKKIVEIAHVAAGISVAKRVGQNRMMIKQTVSRISNVFLVDTALIEAEAIKHIDYLNAVAVPGNGVYSVRDIFVYKKFYSEDYTELPGEQQKVFMRVFKHILDCTNSETGTRPMVARDVS